MISCSPTITVYNITSFDVVATINSGGKRQVVSPSPGETSSAEAQQGAYTATVIPSQVWRDHAQATRDYLNSQLAHPENLTGPQLLEVVQRLKDIAGKLKEYEDAYQTLEGASCTATIGENGGGIVKIGTDSDGTLWVICSGSQ